MLKWMKQFNLGENMKTLVLLSLTTKHSTQTLFEERTRTLSKILWLDFVKHVFIIFPPQKILKCFVELCILTKINNPKIMKNFTFNI